LAKEGEFGEARVEVRGWLGSEKGRGDEEGEELVSCEKTSVVGSSRS